MTPRALRNILPTSFLSCLLLLWMCPDGAGEELTPSPISVSNAKYSVTLAGETPSVEDSFQNEFTFDVTHNESGKLTRLVVGPDRSTRNMRIAGLRLLDNDRLVIHGQHISGGAVRNESLFIADLKATKLLDNFCCRKPALSPRNHFYAYVKCSPPRGAPSWVTTHLVLIYDLRKLPAEQRLGTPGYEGTFLPHEEPVGLPIYPEANAQARAYYVPEQHDPAWPYCTIESPLLWSADEASIVFLSLEGQQGYLVRVALSSGPERPKVFRAAIKITDDEIKPQYRKEVHLRLEEGDLSPARTLYADQMSWHDTTHVIIKPNPAAYHLQDEIKLSVP